LEAQPQRPTRSGTRMAIRSSIAASPQNGGTEFDGFSRLDDGDLNWKSNPYLTKTFTSEDDSLHPQWVVIDLGKKQDVNAIRIVWAEPYARVYQVDYWTGEDAMDDQGHGEWKKFESGAVSNGKSGTVTLPLGSPVKVKFVRVSMTESSNLRHSWFERSTELPGLRYQGALPRDRGQPGKLQRSASSQSGSAAVADLLLVG
jgi:hypothetical protein